MDKTNGLLPPELSGLSSANRYREEKKPSAAELGQSQFLELMITQLNNQDPMNPMESGDFLGQLAQFGTVNGISELQKSVVSMADALQSNQALQASTLVGRSALIESDVLTVGAEPAYAAADLPQAAGSVRVRIQDAVGQTVKELDLGTKESGPIEFNWDGTGDNGVQLPPGNYRFVVEAEMGDTIERVATYARERIDSVTLSRDGSPPTLNLANQTEVSLAAVKEIM